MAGSKITKDNISKFIEEARLEHRQDVRARDVKDYETMLMEMIREEFKGM